jgi:predicted DNA-binding transcriptional regulator AlpA
MDDHHGHDSHERWVSIEVVAAHLGLSVAGARRLARALDLPRRKWGHRTVRYRLGEVDAVLGQLSLDR